MDNIKEIVKNVIGKMSQNQPDTQTKLEQVWLRFVDEKHRTHARLAGLKDNTIYIVVDSPAQFHQLKSKKDALLRNFKQEVPSIKNIVYKVGQM
jgi:hypothetical protein